MINKLSNNTTSHRDRITQVFGKTPAAIALALFALVLPACTGTNSDSAGREAATTTSEVADRSNSNLIGKTVTISGDIQRQVSPQAFTIQSDEFVNGQEVLVVNANKVPIVEGTLTRVTGTVRDLTIVDVEKEYGFDLDPGLEAQIREQPVIVATQVALNPNLEKITENPVPFLGRTVAIEGDVERVISPTAFMVDNNEVLGDDDILIVSAAPAKNITEGSRVQVTGNVRKLTTRDLEREFNLDPAKEYEVYVQKQPAIVAERTQVVGQ
jgi:hypothetical protein